METLPPQGMVLSTHILLVYCQMKNNVSIAQIELVMESESAISADFFPYIYFFFCFWELYPSESIPGYGLHLVKVIQHLTSPSSVYIFS